MLEANEIIRDESYIMVIIILFLVVIAISIALIVVLNSRRRKYVMQKAKDEANELKFKIIAEAKKEIAQSNFEAKNSIQRRNNEILLKEQELDLQREEVIIKINDININKQYILEEKININNIKNDLLLKEKKAIALLEKASNFTAEQAKQELLNFIESNYFNELSEKIKEKEDMLKFKSKEVASRMLIDAMQKCNIEVTTDKNTTIFDLDDDSWKGKIIGKEGRNIKTFQMYCGVDIIVDDTPNRIIISSFNPIRREIAFQVLSQLVKTGRIQPASIEEQIIIQSEKLEKTFEEIGFKVAVDLKIVNKIPSEIIHLLGKLKYRQSYGQNALQHSIEVGRISKEIASKLELNKETALIAGLLHDIGKAVDFEEEGTHVSVGVEILKKHNIDHVIVNAVHSHHGDCEKETIYAEIVAIADGISAARPGARNNDAKDYFIRMEELEQVCLEEQGVSKVYVLQSGRQIRVIVNPNIIDDYSLKKLIIQLREKINKINKTPGEITLTIIREKRESLKI
ncbi:ribonuclease Y [Spiroplasma corruscae]|uniref:Ribonuclease Y n=1 Tax=Spiroplasma corruscae TaxID=216934 RepID=A0A222EPT6_9MOLU|nr:Rnase Y domain-containing protein [Spiroplasma corruscae]ASP28537.1 ribonuclease Y [Spiroplasma corruscae]